MNIDEFLDRELSELGLQTDRAEKIESSSKPELKESSQLKEGFEPSPLFESIKNSLSKGDIESAEQSYLQLWQVLLEQKLKWDKDLYEQLLSLGRQFLSAIDLAHKDLKRKADYIFELIKRARDFLKEGKKDHAFRLYSEAEKIYSSIPNIFFEEKRAIETEIMGLYKELKSVTDSELIKRAASLIQEIGSLISKADSSIKANDFINAIESYNNCIGLYAQLPEGFLRYKNSLGIQILDIYKTLSINVEVSNLLKQLSISSQPMAFPHFPHNVQHRMDHKMNQLRTLHTQALHTQATQAHNKAAAFKPSSEAIPQAPDSIVSSKPMLSGAKKEHARRNVQKGFYDEALKDIESALKIEPNDPEAKVMLARIKTLQ